MIKDKSFLVGRVSGAISKAVPNIQTGKAIYQSYGLSVHIQKRHPECMQYIQSIPSIISSPDYIGVNPNEGGISFELVKVYADNIQIGIKLDTKEGYLYVATLHTITSSKLANRVASNRLVKV